MLLNAVIAAAGTLMLTSIGTSAGMEQTQAARQATGGAMLAAAAQPEHSSVIYAVGDRLKIAFYEQIQKELSGRQTERPVLSSLIEQSELTGEYLVQEDGQIFLPLLGPVHAAGHSPQELEQALVAAFVQSSNAQAKISIQLIEREPVYVTGLVAKPGTFKHVPGMTILHALTLAGSVEGGSTEYWRLLDVTRERERLLKSEERLKKLLARTAVLKAEREGKAPEASKQLAALAGQAAAQELVAREERLRLLEQGRRKGQEAAYDAAIGATQSELTLSREKVLQVGSRVSEKAERVAAMETLRARGTTTDMTYHAARSELSDARERLHEAKAVVTQTQRKLSEVQQEKVRLGVDAEIDREREFKDSLNSIAEEEVTRATIGRLLLPSADAIAPQQGPQERSYTIVRRTANGLRRLSASDVSALQPGDILQVGGAPAAVVSN
jgi:protein involved in polysaccharide export with SLBB domain